MNGGRDIEQNDVSFATELLHLVRLSAKRWFIAFIVVLSLWFTTIGIFIWYISLPVEVESTSQSVEDAENSDVRQTIGGDYYEGYTKQNSSQTSNEE